MSHRTELEQRFPITVAGVDEPIPDLDDNPQPPFPLSDDDRARWERAPLAKRRLAAYGPNESGNEAARMAAIAIAGECRAQGIGFDIANQLTINIPIQADSTTESRIRKQIPKATRFGYYPKDGRTLLTGCCRDNRPRTSEDTLRRHFAPYCDGACAATCPILRSIRFPERAIDETDYAAMDASDLWAYGSGLNRDVWRQLALIALLEPDRIARCFDAYIFWKLDGAYTERYVRSALRALEDAGIAPVVDNDPPKARHIPALSPEQIAELERRLNVHGKREANLREARMKRSGYLDFLHDEKTRTAEDADELDAWDPKPKTVRSTA